MLQEEKGMVEKSGMHEPAWPAQDRKSELQSS